MEMDGYFAPRKFVPPPPAHAVQLAEHIHNEDIKYVAGAILPLRTGTRMKLLRHLLIDPKTTYLTIDGQAHFRHTSMAGVTRSTARASPGPRSTSMVCHARVLYSTAASTRTVSASSISCCSGFKRKVNSSNLSCNTSESRRIRSARLPLTKIEILASGFASLDCFSERCERCGRPLE